MDEARVLGLYSPGWRVRENEGVGTVYYAPQAGLYFSPDPIDEMAAGSAKPRFPDPRDPHDLRLDARSCPPTYRDAVRAALSAIGSSIARYASAGQVVAPPEMTIAAHPAKGGTWLEFLPASSSLSDAIARCADIPSVSSATLASYHLGGALPPSINYSAAVGFYTLDQ